MINNAPAEFQVNTLVPGYTKALISHNVPSDFDIAGIAVYSTVGVQPTTYTLEPLVEGTTYFVLHEIQPETVVEFAFYDELANNASLIQAQFGLNVSSPIDLDSVLISPPTVTSVDVTAESVEVGTIPGEFTVHMDGSATNVIIQIKKTTDQEWDVRYSGAFVSSINLGTVGDGSYNVRCIGSVVLPDGTVDTATDWSTFESEVDTTSASLPPSAVSNISYTAMKKTIPTESYDLKVDWDWDKGTGGGVKAYKVSYGPTGTGNKYTITAVDTSIILTDIPYDVAHTINIESVPYGNTEAASVVSSFKINDNPVDRVPVGMVFEDFSNDTDIQIGYRYIKAYSGGFTDSDVTFLIDANTGSMAIGKPSVDTGGIAPITVNGETGVLAVNGRVVTDIINAATFELNWIDGGGSQPQFRTANKTSHTDTSDGIWMGYTALDTFYFNMGNADSYLKFDTATGKMKISANIEIEGNGLLGSYYETRYKNVVAETTPATPTGRDPAGWTTNIPASEEGYVLWQTSARINADETVNSTWVTPTESILGSAGKSAYEIWLEQEGNEGKTEEEFIASMQGSTGPGFFRWPITNFSVWSNTDADTAMTALRGDVSSEAAIVGDVLTLYNDVDVSIAETRSWNGTSWVEASLLIHGDMIATGTIIAEKLVANNATFSEAGIDVIYNQGGDDTNYTMKIDLVNGEIHIK